MNLHHRTKAHFRYSLSLTASEQSSETFNYPKSFFFRRLLCGTISLLKHFLLRESTPQPDNSDDRARLRAMRYVLGEDNRDFQWEKLLTTGLVSLTSAAARTSWDVCVCVEWKEKDFQSTPGWGIAKLRRLSWFTGFIHLLSDTVSSRVV